ncbi:hypothetical protein SODALDRAFT_317626 [Sodiomyces alkalinus F11]|uniref:RTA1-domain-containing protein n=1 Tax=Sodiomyces alkalinus (strain CBS 110278 / VKM F-3762 / F11) TaxID=1314773 RepID=A0A3N2PKM1_SODAK|nr:hypothetical protein SODALDRAFT_317626 [Sodiomyces alkalinus F11]ROT35065.1 hypothetical protein SODALDRAFT_317626 [Sodiomyces alkalinus F11]
MCPVEASLYGDYFTMGACVFFAVAFGLNALAQGWLTWRSRAWSFGVYLAIGTVMELLGYVGRAIMAENPWNFEGFFMQLLMLILGPTFVAAAISVTFKHLVLWYGPQYSFIKPALYPWIFVGTDFISIIIQAGGGVVASMATEEEIPDPALLDLGNALLIAGVVFQVINMVFCGGLMLVYLWRRRTAVKNAAAKAAGRSGSSGEDKKVHIFIYAIVASYIFIIIRCIYRIPEMQSGWGSDLMRNEATFLALDGAMILIAVTIITAFHPAFFFPYLGKGKGQPRSAPTVDVERLPAPPAYRVPVGHRMSNRI